MITDMKELTRAVDLKLQRKVLAAATSIDDRVRLSGVTKSRAGAWLNVVPSLGLDLSLQGWEFRAKALYR